MRFAGIEGRWYNKGRWINIFVKKTAGLCYLVTFFPAHSMFVDDKVDVVDNVLLADGSGNYIWVMGK